MKESEGMPAPSNPFAVKALAFDVFGTVVDWRGSIIREGNQWDPYEGFHRWIGVSSLIAGAQVTFRR